MAGFTTCGAHSSINLLLVCYLANFKTDSMINSAYQKGMTLGLVKQNCKLATGYEPWDVAYRLSKEISGGSYVGPSERSIKIAYSGSTFIGYYVTRYSGGFEKEKVFIDKDRIWKYNCVTENGVNKCSYVKFG